MDHFMARYRRLTATGTKMTKNAFNHELETSKLINVFFKIIDEGVRYDREGKTPFTPTKALKMAYHAVSFSRIYTDACKYWRRKLSADNTWENFNTF